jgi:hypothetical protein
LEPIKSCVACNGTGRYYTEHLKIKRKCICTLLTSEEIQEVLGSKKEILTKRNLVLQAEPASSALLFLYLLSKGTCTDEDEEYRALQQANQYGESLGYLMGRRKKIRTEDLGGFIVEHGETVESPVRPIPENPEMGKAELHYEDIVKRHLKEPVFDKKSEEDKTEFHYNIGCINCQHIYKEMLKIGPLIFCPECFKEVFKTKNPLKEEKSVVRAWLSYNQDILLGQHPIKPGV